MIAAPSLPLIIAAFALMLAPLIVLHELGHYLVGRWCGVKAEAFSIGFGRELIGWTDRRGTRWKLSMLPLGGYVQFAGDMNPASMPADVSGLSASEQAGNFHARPLWQRALVVAAGPLTNLMIAIAIFAAFNMAYGRIVATPVIAGFADPSPARAAGLRVGDRIVAIDGNAISSFDELREAVLPYPGATLTIAALRGTTPISVKLVVATALRKDEFGNESRIGQIGVGAGRVAVARAAPVEAVRLAGVQTFGIMRLMGTGIVQIFAGQRSVNELGGPMKIARMSGEQLTLGWPEFVYFIAFISINLAFINLLPIPMLDGGHLAFYAAEALRGKPLGARSQEWAFRTGFALVMGLMVFVTVNDLLSFHWLGR